MDFSVTQVTTFPVLSQCSTMPFRWFYSTVNYPCGPVLSSLNLLLLSYKCLFSIKALYSVILNPSTNNHCADSVVRRDGTVVRALASHQCSPSLITAHGLSLLLVLVLLQEFFFGFSSLPLSTKTKIYKFQFN